MVIITLFLIFYDFLYVKLTGACANCSIADFEIKDTVEAILTSEIPEVLEVKQIDAN